MKEQVINYETAKLAKEKGFNIDVVKYYNPKGYCTESYGYQTDRYESSNWNNGQGSYPTLSKDVECSAPTQSLLQKWLREKHELSLEIFSLSYHNKIQFTFNLKKLNKYEIAILSKDNLHYNSHEEALGAGLIESLKLI